MSRKHTISEKKQRAEKKHPNQVMVETDERLYAQDKHKFLCPIHGPYLISYNNFINSPCGCSDCGIIYRSKKRKITLNSKKQRAKERHPDQVMIEIDETLKIKSDKHRFLCPIHGEYSSLFGVFMRSPCGCPKCSFEAGNKVQAEKTKLSIAEKKESVEKRHPNQILLSTDENLKAHDIHEFLCKFHGEYSRKYRKFIESPCGCLDCAEEYRVKNRNEKRRVTMKQKREKAKKKHPKQEMIITNEALKLRDDHRFLCSIHGEYLIRLDHFMSSPCGCPKCSNDNNRTTIKTKKENAEGKHPNQKILSTDEKLTTHDKHDFYCEIHGKYSSLFGSFMRSPCGCPKCGNEAGIEKMKTMERTSAQLAQVERSKNGYTGKGIPLYDRFAHQISWCESVRRDSNDENILQVKCAYCGQWHISTIVALSARISAINGRSGTAECRLYCSDSCKRNCPTYGTVKYQKGQRPATSVEVTAECRQIVLKRDNWTCQRCQVSKATDPEISLHVHHEQGKAQNPMLANDPDNCYTYCAECHRYIHANIKNCNYHELKVGHCPS